MSSKEERRLADELAGWLEGNGPAPTDDPTTRAVARTAVLLVDALTPQPLHPVTRARLYERALSEARPGQMTLVLQDAVEDPLGELLRVGRHLPLPAWAGLAGIALAAVLGVLLLRQREEETPI